MSAAGLLEPLDADTLQQISATSTSISACMARVMDTVMPVKVPDGSAAAVEVGAGAVIAGHPVAGTLPVELPMSGISIHDAARRLAMSCHLSLVISGQVTATVWPRQPLVYCDGALDAATRWAGLEKRHFGRLTANGGPLRLGGVFRIADLRPSVNDPEQRDAPVHGIHGADPLPRGATVNYVFQGALVRDVLEQLARDGHVEADIAASVGGQVTVFTSAADWDVVLAAVLDAADLGYRYDPRTKRLKIAPLQELDGGGDPAPRPGRTEK